MFRKPLIFAVFIGLCTFASEVADAGELKVLTYNTALLRYRRLGLHVDFDTRIDERSQAIPAAIAATGADVVLLQEVWDKKTRTQLVREFTRLGYPYAAWSSSDPFFWKPLKGEFGNGLLTVSRLPIAAWEFVPYRTHTRAKEYLVAKGVLRTRIETREGCPIDVFNTHMGASEYEPKALAQGRLEFTRRNLEAHSEQTEVLARFVSKTPAGVSVVLGGDMNMHHHVWDPVTQDYSPALTPFYARIIGAPGIGAALTDSYAALRPGAPFQHGFEKSFDNRDLKTPDETLDYLFVRGMRPEGSEIVFREQPLSDHFALISTLGTSDCRN